MKKSQKPHFDALLRQIKVAVLGRTDATNVALADALDIDPSYVTAWRNRGIPASVKVRLARDYGVDLKIFGDGK